MTTELPHTATPDVALTTGTDLDDAPLAPSISSPEAPSREQLRAERALSATVAAWLAHEALPEQAVLWYPHWNDSRPVVVEDRAHLVRLITQLEELEFAGVRHEPTKGPWAQVMNGGDGEYCIELHPHTHGDRPGGDVLRAGRTRVGGVSGRARLGVGAPRRVAGGLPARAPLCAARQRVGPAALKLPH